MTKSVTYHTSKNTFHSANSTRLPSSSNFSLGWQKITISTCRRRVNPRRIKVWWLRQTLQCLSLKRTIKAKVTERSGKMTWCSIRWEGILTNSLSKILLNLRSSMFSNCSQTSKFLMMIWQQKVRKRLSCIAYWTILQIHFCETSSATNFMLTVSTAQKQTSNRSWEKKSL